MSAWRYLALGLVAACGGSDGPFLVVTVDARPAVHDVGSLRVTLGTEGRTRTNTVALGGNDFPVTFAVDTAGRGGALDITIEALDRDGALVGSGTGATTLDAESAGLLIDSVDFVVNTDYAGDQLLSSDADEHGFQLAANPDGLWTSVFRTNCDTPCNVFARRFDETGAPVTSQAGAGTNAFAVSSELTTFYSTPSVAMNGDTSLVVWNAVDPVDTTVRGIACRAFDANGAPKGEQVQLALDTSPYIVSTVALGSGNFAVVWDHRASPYTIQSMIVRPDCSTLVSPIAINTVAGTVTNSAAAATDADVMYAWLLAGNVRVRVLTNTNTQRSADLLLASSTGTEVIEQVRVAPLATGGYAVFVRWVATGSNDAPGRIEMIRTTNLGVQMGAKVVVTTRAGSDFLSSESFGVAAREDGSILVVWHACEARGDGSGCGVYGQLLDPGGALVGTEFLIPTVTLGHQYGASATALPDGAFAVAWTDESGTAPDIAGYAVRARVVYPGPGGGSSKSVPAAVRDLGVVLPID